MSGVRADIRRVVENVASGRPPFEGTTSLDLQPLNDDVGEGWPAAVFVLIATPQARQRSPGWYAQRFWPVSGSTMPSILPGPAFRRTYAERAVEDRAGTRPPEELPHFESDAAYVEAAEADPQLWMVHLLRGTHLESYGIRAFERAFKTRVFEAPAVRHPSGLFTASPDGIGRTPKGVVFLVELKIPFRTKAMADLVEQYRHQLQAELAVIPDAQYVLLVQYCWRDGGLEVAHVERDPNWFRDNRAHIEAFNAAVAARRSAAGITRESWAADLIRRILN